MPKKCTDILVYIALAEEFKHLIDSIDIELTPHELAKHPLTCYKATIDSKTTTSQYSIVFYPSGSMGNTESANKTQLLIAEYNPKNIVVLGIAGSLSSDLAPGDVFIPSNVTEYFANSAAVGNNEIEFKTSGNHYSSDPRLLNRFQNFSVANQIIFKAWQEETQIAFSNYISNEMQIGLSNLGINLKEKAELKVADDRVLASGPVVGKGEAFNNLVKKIDRKAAALEMETAGVYAAVSSYINSPRVISIRGISDLATEKKEDIEGIVGEELRRVCMKNAVNLLRLAIELDFFKAEEEIIDVQEANEEIVLASAIKKVFIVGGETNNASNDDDSIDDLREACRTIGKNLAKASLELIVCSPFNDSADYYAVKGYSAAEKKGRVYFHFPNNNGIKNRLTEFISRLKETYAEIPDIIQMQYADYPIEALKQQAWNICQIQALQYADAVIAIGGKESSSANLLLHLAELWNKPIVPFTLVGGAAKMAYDRIDWNKLYPNIPKKSLIGKNSIKNVVNILHRMSINNIAKEVNILGKVNTVFVSRSTLDSLEVENVGKYLKSKNMNVLLGDNAIVPEKEVIPAINEFMAQSQLFIAFWSKNYALSPWCYDELMFAIAREKVGLIKIILVLLDETPIIPHEARSLICIHKQSFDDINNTLNEILKLE